jgi:hypothetical protein
MLRVVCWKWKPKPGYRSTFGPETVNTLKRMVARHYPGTRTSWSASPTTPRASTRTSASSRCGTITPSVPSPHGPLNPSCYRRLKAFSAEARPS